MIVCSVIGLIMMQHNVKRNATADHRCCVQSIGQVHDQVGHRLNETFSCVTAEHDWQKRGSVGRGQYAA